MHLAASVERRDARARPSTITRKDASEGLTAAFALESASGKILYEEYHPYGTSAYRSSNGSVDVSARRYRYTGKERDEETGLYYNGARYLAAWLGRWTSADPIGIGADGPGLYNYTRGSPVNYTDPTGTLQLPSAAAHTPKMLERAVVEAGQGVASAIDSAWTAVGNAQRTAAAEEQAAALRGARATSSDAEPGIVSEAFHGWASRTTSWSMRPDPALQGLPEGMKQLHGGANQEVTWKGARSAEVIAKVGEIGLGLQTLVSEIALVRNLLSITARNAPEQLTKKMLQEEAKKELLEQAAKGAPRAAEKVAEKTGTQGIAHGLKAAPRLGQPITWLEKDLARVISKHGSSTAGKGGVLKSRFNAGEDIAALIRSGTHQQARPQAGSRNLVRVFDVGRNVGTDIITGSQTSRMTIVTQPGGRLVTAYPGGP